MSSLPSGRPFKPVGVAAIESLLSAAARHSADARVGIFGPESASWKVNRESAVFLGAGRAALLQLAHPWVATALEQHSSVMSRPIARFHNTFRIVYTMIFGTLDQALAASRHLYQLHTHIEGELEEDVAGWKRGAHYQANEIAALRWVFATLVESAVIARGWALGSLSASEREQYYEDSKILAGLFGLPADELPENWLAFEDYNRGMHASSELGVSEAARKMAHDLLSGAGSWIHIPRWYRALTADWMPARFREEFELSFDEADRRAAARAHRQISRIYRRLPEAVRIVGPWHQAQSRLAGQRAGLVSRLSNRFWIGQTVMPFGG